MRRLVLQQSQWFRRSPRFIKGIYWEAGTGLFLRTPSQRGARELMRKPRPLAVNNVALLAPLRSVQFSSNSPEETNLATVHARLARTALERESIIFLGSAAIYSFIFSSFLLNFEPSLN